jgi:hypothetical protein
VPLPGLSAAGHQSLLGRGQVELLRIRTLLMWIMHPLGADVDPVGQVQSPLLCPPGRRRIAASALECDLQTNAARTSPASLPPVWTRLVRPNHCRQCGSAQVPDREIRTTHTLEIVHSGASGTGPEAMLDGERDAHRARIGRISSGFPWVWEANFDHRSKSVRSHERETPQPWHPFREAAGEDLTATAGDRIPQRWWWNWDQRG